MNDKDEKDEKTSECVSDGECDDDDDDDEYVEQYSIPVFHDYIHITDVYNPDNLCIRTSITYGRKYLFD